MRRVAPSNRLHVLLTTDVVGGVWDFCRVLATELLREGHRVTLLALGSPGVDQQRQAAGLGTRLISVPLKLEWMRDSADDVLATRALVNRLVAELQPDVVHASQFCLGDLGGTTPIVLTAHSDVLSWHRWVRGAARTAPPAGKASETTPPEADSYAALVQRGLNAADEVVAVSHFLADELTSLYGLQRDVRVIHNGWPANALVSAPADRRQGGTLLAGRAWDEAKNIRLAVSAAQGWPCGTVALAGELRHPDSGCSIEIGEPITTLGKLPFPTLERRLTTTRVYLAPARYEPFGLLPLQSALAGCALLLSDIPSFRELWRDAALFFRSNDVAELRAQWQLLLSDDALARRIAAAARRRALASYGAARMAADYLEAYEAVLERRQHGRRPRLLREPAVPPAAAGAEWTRSTLPVRAR